MNFYYQTDCGLVRPINEDNAMIIKKDNGDVFMMVLDGMGGHNKGEKASSMAMEILKDRFEKCPKIKSMFLFKRYIIKSIKKANKEINILGTNNIEYHEMGTTLILVCLHNDKILMCNIGDSRFYLSKNLQINQISEDQTYVQFLYKTGKIKKEDIKIHPKRHVLMNALGTYPSVSIASKVMKYQHEKILLCSDGLYNMLEDNDILSVLQNNLSTKEKVEKLIAKANENGGQDNIAIALLEE